MGNLGTPNLKSLFPRKAKRGRGVQSDSSPKKAPSREKSMTERANLGRHRRNCLICSHTQREEIENDFVMWKSPSRSWKSADYEIGQASIVMPMRESSKRPTALLRQLLGSQCLIASAVRCAPMNIVLLDIAMPNLDGIKAASRIRSIAPREYF